MKKILAIIYKDVRLRFSGVAEWLFFLILPLIFTVVLAGSTGASSDSRIRLVVVDQANSPLSQNLMAELGKSPAIRAEVLPLAEAESQFSQRNATIILIIPAEFNLARLETGSISLELREQPNALDAVAAGRAVQTVTGRIGSAVEIANRSTAEAEKIRPFKSAGARQTYFAASLQEAQTEMANAPSRLTTTQGTTQNRITYDPRANSSAGQLITWVFVPLMSISSLFAFERQNGTLRRLLTTPTSKATFLVGTIAGQVAISIVQMLLLISFGILVMKVNWGRDPAALAVILISSALAGAALGTTLGTFVKTEGQASGLSILFGMLMALLGGCWYPIELFPESIRTAVLVLPTRWAMQGMLDLVLRGQGLIDILPIAGVLLGFAVVFFSIGVLRFRYE
jgi:ABC-2 type transport system permease protein